MLTWLLISSKGVSLWQKEETDPRRLPEWVGYGHLNKVTLGFSWLDVSAGHIHEIIGAKSWIKFTNMNPSTRALTGYFLQQGSYLTGGVLTLIFRWQ